MLLERQNKQNPSDWRIFFDHDSGAALLKKKSEARDWKLEWAIADLTKFLEKGGQPSIVRYRPFDDRFTYFTGKTRGFICMPRGEVMGFLTESSEPNIALLTSRMTKGESFEHAHITSSPAEVIGLSPKTSNNAFIFPLWLKRSTGEPHRRPNVDRVWAQDIGKAVSLTYDDGIPRDEQKSFGSDFERKKTDQLGPLDTPWDGRGDLQGTFGPRDLFDYIYAVLHSPGYRSRYAEFLKSDFPRISTPKSRATFADLIPLGRALVALHLVRPEEAPVLQNPTARFAGSGEARVAKGFPEYRNGRIMINETRWFEDVPKETWEFQVGGYQVCEKWLKDRAGKGGKNPGLGRVLTDDDILHYRRTVTALTETRRLMTEIDQVIQKHGGWPGAFYQPPPPSPTVEEIIGADESRDLEFKSTFEWDINEGKQNRGLQKQVLKTLAAFMNTDGGTLVIGVTDDKEIIGLGADLKLVRDSIDLFENKLMSVFSSAIGAPYSLHCKLRFADAQDGKKVCVIDVAASKEPVFVDFQGEHSFFIRRGNGTVSLNASEQHVYIRQRFTR